MFYLGEDIAVTITKIQVNSYGDLEVFLGFDAPKDVRILRQPIMEAIKRQKDYENEGFGSKD